MRILTDKNYLEFRNYYKIPEKHILLREYFNFGYCPTFCNPNTQHNIEENIYCYEGKTYTWQELKAHLKKTWHPTSDEDLKYYFENIAE